MHMVHTEASAGWGGQEVRILTEAAGMQARGHRVSLLCLGGTKLFAEAQARAIPVYAMPFKRKGVRGVYAVYRWLRAHDADVVNTHSSIDSWLVGLANLFLPRAIPVVRTRHISAPISNSLTSRWLYQRATRYIVTTGEKLREQLMRDNGFDGRRIVSIPTGIDTARFKPGERAQARRALGLPQAVPIIGIVATLRSWKGHRFLLEAFARLENKNARLLIVGDGPQRAALEQQAAALNIAARVIMAGNQAEVVPWLQALDIFVLPSYANEGVPQALMQAMLTALPIVTTPVGSITDIITDEVTGLLVPPSDAAALHDAIVRLLNDGALCARLGSAALDYAQTHCGMQPMLTRMEALFNAVRRDPGD